MFPVKNNWSAVWYIEPIDYIDKRSFPTTVWSYKTDSLSLCDIEINITDDMMISHFSIEIA